ncbi:MAG: PKD domain-containing protein, partial [Halobacteria archaeon]|nr:PKD domain-containing protein [Halobacteria archaeon]
MKREKTEDGTESFGADKVGTHAATLFAQSFKILLILLVVSSVFAGMAGTAAAGHKGGIHDIDIINVEDRDGDGFASSFQIRVDANTKIAGHEVGKGDPAFAISVSTQRNSEVPLYSNSVARKNGEFIYEFDGSDVLDAKEFDGHQIVFLLPVKIAGAEVVMYDIDKGPGIFGYDVGVDRLTLVQTQDEVFGIERKSNDRTAEVEITSNVNGASVYVNGQKRGTTPWTGEFPVDVGKRQGDTHIEVNKDGYYSSSHTFELSPPESHNFDLRKVKKPVVVTAEQEDATVKIDGNKVGETPWSGQRWVNSEFDITVNKSGYIANTFQDVSPEASVHANLTPLSTVSDIPTGQLTPGSIPQYDYTLPGLNNSSSSGDDSNTGSSSGSNTNNLYVPPGVTSNISTIQPVLPDLSITSFFLANFTHTPSNPLAGQTMTFDASSTYSLGSSIQSYDWNFGDGSSANGKIVRHSYPDDGSYNVELTVTNSQGNRSTVQRTVNVQNDDPDAQFSFTPSSANE